MADLAPLTNEAGTGINFGRLATVLVGMISGSFFGGWAAAVKETFQAWMINPLLGLAGWLDNLVMTYGGGLADAGATAWAESTAFAFSLGLFAPVFAVGLYFAISYIVALVRQEVSG